MHVREWKTAEFVDYLSRSGLDVVHHCLLPEGRLPRIEELALP